MSKLKKIKHKTKKSLSKSVVVLGSGAMKSKSSHSSHCASAKTTKSKSQLSKSALFNDAQYKMTAHLLQGKS